MHNDIVNYLKKQLKLFTPDEQLHVNFLEFKVEVIFFKYWYLQNRKYLYTIQSRKIHLRRFVRFHIVSQNKNLKTKRIIVLSKHIFHEKKE